MHDPVHSLRPRTTGKPGLHYSALGEVFPASLVCVSMVPERRDGRHAPRVSVAPMLLWSNCRLTSVLDVGKYLQHQGNISGMPEVVCAVAVRLAYRAPVNTSCVMPD